MGNESNRIDRNQFTIDVELERVVRINVGFDRVINARLARFADEGLLFISVLTDPTTAGVSASYALIGDVNIAEPNALIGFTGERITGSSVGEDELEALRRAQRAEKVLEHGFVDMIVPRNEMRQTLARLYSLLLNSRSGAKVRV